MAAICAALQSSPPARSTLVAALQRAVRLHRRWTAPIVGALIRRTRERILDDLRMRFEFGHRPPATIDFDVGVGAPVTGGCHIHPAPVTGGCQYTTLRRNVERQTPTPHLLQELVLSPFGDHDDCPFIDRARRHRCTLCRRPDPEYFRDVLYVLRRGSLPSLRRCHHPSRTSCRGCDARASTIGRCNASCGFTG